MSSSYRRRRANNGDLLTVAGIVALVVIVAIVCIVWFGAAQKMSTRVVTVCDKERVTKSDSSEYRVYTNDGTKSHTYVVKDNLIGGVRYNSADFYGEIVRGTTYELKVKGYRNGFTSHFPNIMEKRKVTEQHPEWCE